jgi:cellulose biosynthesis protein BcsQ
MYNISCLIKDQKNTFAVQIDEALLVSNLKASIKAEKPNFLASVDADDLQLYHVNIPFDLSGEKKHLKQANHALQDGPLHEYLRLSAIEKRFPEQYLHILVQCPPSGSTHSSACGTAAETML